MIEELDWIFLDVTIDIIMANLVIDDINLIKNSWYPVRKDTKTAGLLLFKGLFTQFPEYLKLFPQFGNMDFDQMSTNARLVRHATKVIDTVTFVVDNIGNKDSTEELNDALLALVRSHLNRSIGLKEFKNLGVALLDFICTINHQYQGKLNSKKLRKDSCYDYDQDSLVRDNQLEIDKNNDSGHFVNYSIDDFNDDDNDDDDDNNNDGDNQDNHQINSIKFDTNAVVTAWTKLYSNILDLVKIEEEAALASSST